jgi:hypothetical protein
MLWCWSRLGKQLLKISQLSTKDNISLFREKMCPWNSLAMQFLLSSDWYCPVKHWQVPELQTIWSEIQFLSTTHSSPYSALFAEKQNRTSYAMYLQINLAALVHNVYVLQALLTVWRRLTRREILWLFSVAAISKNIYLSLHIRRLG